MYSIHQHGCHVSCDPALWGSACSEDGLHGLLAATESKLEQGDCTKRSLCRYWTNYWKFSDVNMPFLSTVYW